MFAPYTKALYATTAPHTCSQLRSNPRILTLTAAAACVCPGRSARTYNVARRYDSFCASLCEPCASLNSISSKSHTFDMVTRLVTFGHCAAADLHGKWSCEFERAPACSFLTIFDPLRLSLTLTSALPPNSDSRSSDHPIAALAQHARPNVQP